MWQRIQDADFLRRWLFVLALVGLFLTGAAVRRSVLAAQYAASGEVLPFTLESALQYRLVRMVVDDGRLPVVDEMVGYPEGLQVRRAYTVGAEYVYAALVRLLPSAWPLAERLRWVTMLWFCLGIPFMALWVWQVSGSRWGGWVAAAFYAVALSSVIRSTGQEVARENFALPLLLAHLAADARALRKSKRDAVFSWASGVLLGAALCTWDLVQYYVLLLAACAWFDLARGRFETQPPLARHRARQWIVLVLCGVFNPYLRAHQWLLSPAMLWALGIGLCACGHRALHRRSGRNSARKQRLMPLVVPLLAFVPLGLGWFVAAGYQESYGHFFELLAAKLRFLNTKPHDPALLTFNQRILWVPALQSTTLRMAFILFPALLGLTVAGMGVIVKRLKDKRLLLQGQYISFQYVCSLVLFFLFFRFHVYLAVFASAVAGIWFGVWCRDPGVWKKVILGFLFIPALAMEAGQVLENRAQWGRPNVYYREAMELAEQLEERVAPMPVLANFGISAFIATYADCPVVLHPKFEDLFIRDRVQAYGEALFLGDEESFRDWMDDLGVRYYVYALGEFSEQSPERQMRYFIDALNPPDEAPARLFEFNPYDGRFFHYVWGNRKYRIFRMRSRMDERIAEEQAFEARTFLEQGRLADAERAALAALELNPYNEQGRRILRHVDALRARGFSYDADEAETEP